MTSKQLDELEAKAKAATPGPWYVVQSKSYDEMWFFSSVEGPEFYDDNGNDYNEILGHSVKNAQFVAAVNPSVVLELITEIRELRAYSECDYCDSLRSW